MSQEDKRVEREPEHTAGAEVAEARPEAPEAEEPAGLAEHDTLEQLQQELEEARAKAEENWSLYLRSRAEADNVRRRAERDVANAHKFALEKFIGELLPIRDSLELGLAAARESVDVEKLKEGTDLTLKMLNAALDKARVKEIDPQGERFDPQFHEAMAMQPSAEVEPNTVLHVVQKGYTLNERLVRPAMVIVSRAADKPAGDVENPDVAPK